MPKITDEPLATIQLKLFQKDLDTLRELYAGNIGVNKVIRTIIRSYITQTDALANTQIDNIETIIEDEIT